MEKSAEIICRFQRFRSLIQCRGVHRFETARLKAFSRSPESVNQNFDFADSLDIPSKPGSHAAHRSPFASFASTSTLDGRRHFSTSLRSLTKKAAVAGFDKPVKAPTKRKAAVPKVKKEVVELDVSVPMKREVSVLLAKKFELGGKISPVGYWVSEKCQFILPFPTRVIVVLVRRSSGTVCDSFFFTQN